MIAIVSYVQLLAKKENPFHYTAVNEWDRKWNNMQRKVIAWYIWNSKGVSENIISSKIKNIYQP